MPHLLLNPAVTANVSFKCLKETKTAPNVAKLSGVTNRNIYGFYGLCSPGANAAIISGKRIVTYKTTTSGSSIYGDTCSVLSRSGT